MRFINKPDSLRTIKIFKLGGIAMLLILSFAFPADASSAGPGDKPNVVIMVADDIGWADVGFHGGPIDTPSLDRLAKEGMDGYE